MISVQKYLSFQFEEPETIKNITSHVEMVLKESKVKEGIVPVSYTHLDVYKRQE